MPFVLEETTIVQIHDAIRTKQLSCAELIASYLGRVHALDRNGPVFNSIVTLNENAITEATEKDTQFRASGELCGPLHGIPILVKDQAETAGIMTCFGSVACDGYIPHKDATAIARLRDAGAIILGKTTMPDFATSWFSYSSKSGTTKNPYNLGCDPGGSSSGTGASIAANLAAIGLGEDTGGSIRLPASFNNLVGLKVTPGLISRAGMSPLVVFQDSAGPMCRTVTDTARMLDVLAGYDPADPYTATAVISGQVSYSKELRARALRGTRIGVVRELFGNNADAECCKVNTVIESALLSMEHAGAHIIDIQIPQLAHYVELSSMYVTHSRHDIDHFLQARPQLPLRTLREIINAQKYHPKCDLLEALVDGPGDPYSAADYYTRYMAREEFQRVVINEMAKSGAEALAFPTAQVPPPSRKELDAGAWPLLEFPTNTLLAAQAWMPALSVPAGLTPDGLPVGLELVGFPFQEARLLSLGYSFERKTRKRVPSPHA